MTLLEHLQHPPLHNPSAVSYTDVQDAFLKMVEAEHAYREARKKWAGFNPLCAPEIDALNQARHDYIRVTVLWFKANAVLS